MGKIQIPHKVIHQDYNPIQMGIHVSGSGRDMREYMEEYGSSHDIRPNFRAKVIDLYNPKDLYPHTLHLLQLHEDKTQNQIQTDLELISVPPAVLVERWIAACALGLDRPAIFGFLDGQVGWIYTSMKSPKIKGVDLLERDSKIWAPSTYVLREALDEE